jgi:hypothetical protein
MSSGVGPVIATLAPSHADRSRCLALHVLGTIRSALEGRDNVSPQDVRVYERHEITSTEPDRWMVAHRGWTVTDITRLPAS